MTLRSVLNWMALGLVRLVGRQQAQTQSEPDPLDGSVAASGAIEFCGQSLDLKTTKVNCQLAQVTDLSPLSGLTGLTYLDLTGTQVTDLSPLSGLTGLTALHGLNHTKAAPADVDALRQALPNCDIQF